MNKPNTLALLILLLLTGITFVLGDHSSRLRALLILALAGLKCLLVAWQFMELRRAARAWFAGVALLLLLILGLSAVLV